MSEDRSRVLPVEPPGPGGESKPRPVESKTRTAESKARQTLQERFKRAFATAKATEESNTTMITDEKIESQQNTDPVSDPADDVVTPLGGETAEVAPEVASPRTEDLGAVPAIELLRLKAERDQLIDRVARLQADFDNSRKREARERADFREYAVAGAVEQFLPVLDNFQLALKSTGSAEQLRTGVELIVKQMEEALKTLNVQPVETVGTMFDPRVHEALDSVDQPDLPDQQVFSEVRRGYKIKERLLRPALVRVVNNPQQKEA